MNQAVPFPFSGVNGNLIQSLPNSLPEAAITRATRRFDDAITRIESGLSSLEVRLQPVTIHPFQKACSANVAPMPAPPECPLSESMNSLSSRLFQVDDRLIDILQRLGLD